LQDYLELVNWTGRIIRYDKRGFIKAELPPILERLQVSPDQWRIYNYAVWSHSCPAFQSDNTEYQYELATLYKYFDGKALV